MSNYPKKIKLIRDKYPTPLGTIYSLMYQKKEGFGKDYSYSYISNLEEDKAKDDAYYAIKDGHYSRCRPLVFYKAYYISDKKDEISLEESRDTYWFEPITKEPLEMTLEEVQNKLGIKNLVIKST